MLRLTIQEPGIDPFAGQDATPVRTWHDVSGAVCAHGYVGADTRWMSWPGFATFRFNGDGTLHAFPERPLDPSLIVDLARRTVEPLALQAMGFETLHASAVLTPAGCCAFCGERTTGKSTLAFALSRHGYAQQSDDMVVLQIERGTTRVLDRPFGVRLRPEAAAFFGFIPANGRHFQDVATMESRPTPTLSTHPLAALFVLRRVASGEPHVERLQPGAAFRAVVANAFCFDPTDAAARRRMLQHYLHMTATAAVYELRFTPGLDRLGSILTCVEDAIRQMQAESV